MDQLIKLLINVIKEIASAAFLLDSSEAREHMDRLREPAWTSSNTGVCSQRRKRCRPTTPTWTATSS